MLAAASHDQPLPCSPLLPLPPSLCCTQVSYPAELAGLHYGVRPTSAGLLFSVYGYADKLPTLAQVGEGLCCVLMHSLAADKRAPAAAAPSACLACCHPDTSL